MILRDYQARCHEAAFAALEEGPSALIVMPTGAGKTVVFGSIARDWPDGRVLIIAHRDELIRQAADKVGRICGETCAIEMGEERSNEEGKLYLARVVITSVQTMSRESRHSRFDPHGFSLVVIDEAHHATAESYLKVLAHFRQNPNIKVLGVTATPDRADEEALGKVFANVCFEYGIRDAIDDGWLVPIQQQLVVVDGLDLSHCRTTAGDLNSADLNSILIAEKTLHGVVDPTMQIAGDRKTLVFTASVAQAERGAEIANRHRWGCARWVSGETDPIVRRDLVKDYARGEFQFLFNCGIALEGFDDPGIQVVSMARPTKSRSLYAQAIGRGTRPLPDLVDSLATPEERRAAIAASDKPAMLVLDFVGNSGRHKLVHATDVLGVDYDDDQLQEALDEIMAKSREGEAMDVEDAFRAAEERRENARRQKEIEEEERRRREEEEQLRRASAGKRQGVIAKAQYKTRTIDPFDVFSLDRRREPGWHKGRKPTPKMLNLLKKAGLPDSELEKLTFCTAGQLIEEVTARWKNGQCSFNQAKLLKRYGYQGNESFQEASRLITAIKNNGWKPLN